MPKTYNKLVGCGCSFSDYCGNPTLTFNAYAAKQLELPYLDLTAGASSNLRWTRILTSEIRKGNITKDDLLVLQFTNPSRTEFVTDLPRNSSSWSFPTWNAVTNPIFDARVHKSGKPIDEKYNDKYWLLRHMPQSGNWADNKIIKEWHSLYMKYFYCEEYVKELFLNQLFSLQQILKEFNVIYIYTGYINHEIKLEPFMKMLNNNTCVIEAMSMVNKETTPDLKYCLDAPFDCAHINQAGHEVIGRTIVDLVELNSFSTETPPNLAIIK